MQSIRLDGLDAVSVFLKQRGHVVEAAYFGKSEVQIGYQISDGDLRVVYRFDQQDGVLLICSVQAIASTLQATGAVRKLVRLLRQIEAGVPEMREIHGLVIEDVLSPALRKERAQLRQIYEACGAKPVQMDGQNWMVYRSKRGQTADAALH